MMSCPLPLLPLLPPALHADFPPVHIGIKVSQNVNRFIYLLHLRFEICISKNFITMGVFD
jgi:hypothetical protein